MRRPQHKVDRVQRHLDIRYSPTVNGISTLTVIKIARRVFEKRDLELVFDEPYEAWELHNDVRIHLQGVLDEVALYLVLVIDKGGQHYVHCMLHSDKAG